MSKGKKQKPQMLTVEFEWQSTTPDPRPFNQQRHVYKPIDTSIVVTVPLTADFVTNWDDHIQYQLGTIPDKPKIGLTPLGQFTCVHKLEEHYALMEITAAKEEAEENEKLEWEDESEMKETEKETEEWEE